MVKKTPIQGSDRVSVTFELGQPGAARSVCVAGDFNGWDPTTHALKQRKDGTWALTVRLPKGREYAYRYVINGDEWITDPDADTMVANEYGGENAVVSLR